MNAVPIRLTGSDGVSNDVVIDDVDGDGHNDVVVATESGPNRIYYGHEYTTTSLSDMGVKTGRDHMFGTWTGADWKLRWMDKLGVEIGDDIWDFVRSRPGVPKQAVAYWMYVIKDSNSGLLDSIVRLLPRGAREDGEEEADGSTRRRRGSPDSGINAEFLKTLLQPDEDEKKLVKNFKNY